MSGNCVVCIPFDSCVDLLRIFAFYFRPRVRTGGIGWRRLGDRGGRLGAGFNEQTHRSSTRAKPPRRELVVRSDPPPPTPVGVGNVLISLAFFQDSDSV